MGKFSRNYIENSVLLGKEIAQIGYQIDQHNYKDHKELSNLFSQIKNIIINNNMNQIIIAQVLELLTDVELRTQELFNIRLIEGYNKRVFDYFTYIHALVDIGCNIKALDISYNNIITNTNSKIQRNIMQAKKYGLITNIDDPINFICSKKNNKGLNQQQITSNVKIDALVECRIVEEYMKTLNIFTTENQNNKTVPAYQLRK